jgi:adenine-specific DNA-methyltransferase
MVSMRTLCRLLNTAAADARFRRISGSVSVSTTALRQLPLPAAEQVRAAFKEGLKDEEAAELAYMRSLERRSQVPVKEQMGTRHAG